MALMVQHAFIVRARVNIRAQAQQLSSEEVSAAAQAWQVRDLCRHTDTFSTILDEKKTKKNTQKH